MTTEFGAVQNLNINCISVGTPHAKNGTNNDITRDSDYKKLSRQDLHLTHVCA